MRSFQAFVIILFSAATLYAFEVGYPPVIANRSGVPVHVTLHWRGDRDQDAFLPNGSKSFQRLQRRHLSSITVIRQGTSRSEYDEQFLARRRHESPSTYEVWVITTDTLLLRGKDALKNK
jgi:hypothetical protein